MHIKLLKDGSRKEKNYAFHQERTDHEVSLAPSSPGGKRDGESIPNCSGLADFSLLGTSLEENGSEDPPREEEKLRSMSSNYSKEKDDMIR